MVTARSIVIQEALCALTVQRKSRWQAEGVFRGREIGVYGCDSEEEAVQVWERIAESIATKQRQQP